MSMAIMEEFSQLVDLNSMYYTAHDYLVQMGMARNTMETILLGLVLSQ